MVLIEQHGNITVNEYPLPVSGNFLKRKTKSILVKCFTIFSSLYRTISYFRLYGYFFIKKTVPYGNDVRYGSDSVTVNYNVICFYFRKNIIFKHNIEDVQLFWLSNFLFKQKKMCCFTLILTWEILDSFLGLHFGFLFLLKQAQKGILDFNFSNLMSLDVFDLYFHPNKIKINSGFHFCFLNLMSLVLFDLYFHPKKLKKNILCFFLIGSNGSCRISISRGRIYKI